MNRAPTPEAMFERLLKVLKLEKSEFIPEMKTGNGAKFRKDGTPHSAYRETVTPAHMTRGLTLEKNSPGDGYTRISVATHSGEGTGEGQILCSMGAREFAEKVWAIEAGIECARQLGVKVGDL